MAGLEIKDRGDGYESDLAKDFSHYIAAFMDGEQLGEPVFDDLTSPWDLGHFLARLADAAYSSSNPSA